MNFRGGFNPSNLQNLMKQAQKMQEQMEEDKQKLHSQSFVGKSGGSMVEVTLSGDKKVQAVAIKPEVVDSEDVEMLQDLIVSAFNDALSQIAVEEEKTNPKMPAGF